MTVRKWIGFVAAGVAVVLGYRGHWALAGVAAVFVVVPAGLWFRDEMAAMKALYREGMQEPGPAPSGGPELVPAPRVRREEHPPWETAPMPVVPVVADREEVRVARHGKRRGLRDSFVEVVTAVARVGLKD